MTTGLNNRQRSRSALLIGHDFVLIILCTRIVLFHFCLCVFLSMHGVAFIDVENRYADGAKLTT